MTARDWPERVPTWRGLSVGDTIAIACWPDHAKVIDTIEYHWPRPGKGTGRWARGTIEWATVWCRHVRDPRTRSRTDLRIDAAGQPVYHQHHTHLDADGMWAGFHITEHPVLILAPAPGRNYTQIPLIGATP